MFHHYEVIFQCVKCLILILGTCQATFVFMSRLKTHLFSLSSLSSSMAKGHLPSLWGKGYFGIVFTNGFVGLQRPGIRKEYNEKVQKLVHILPRVRGRQGKQFFVWQICGFSLAVNYNLKNNEFGANFQVLHAKYLTVTCSGTTISNSRLFLMVIIIPTHVTVVPKCWLFSKSD